MSSDDVDLLQLQDRYNYLVKEYVDLSAKIAPLLEKWGKIKKEIDYINEEFHKKGKQVEEDEAKNEEYEKKLNEAIETANGEE